MKHTLSYRSKLISTPRLIILLLLTALFFFGLFQLSMTGTLFPVQFHTTTHYPIGEFLQPK